DVRLPHHIAGQVDLAQDVQSAGQGRILIDAQQQHRAPRYKALSRVGASQARLGDVVVPHDAAAEVCRQWVGGVVGGISKLEEEQVWIEVAPGTGRLDHGEGGEDQC